MYQPPHFRIEDQEDILGLIQAHPLGLLISAGAGGLLANPVPFVAVQIDGMVDLRCHLARPNPQWQALEQGAEALAVFQGDGAYVTPSWYETKRETGKVVPTWNYMIVQARGSVTVHHECALAACTNRPDDQSAGNRPVQSLGLWPMRRRISRRRKCAALSGSICASRIGRVNSRSVRTATRATVLASSVAWQVRIQRHRQSQNG